MFTPCSKITRLHSGLLQSFLEIDVNEIDLPSSNVLCGFESRINGNSCVKSVNDITTSSQMITYGHDMGRNPGLNILLGLFMELLFRQLNLNGRFRILMPVISKRILSHQSQSHVATTHGFLERPMTALLVGTKIVNFEDVSESIELSSSSRA